MVVRSSAKLYGNFRTPRVLNPTLYSLLKDRFGSVAISVQGEKAIFGAPIYVPARRRFESTIVHEGEYYRIDCPYCGDTQKRLYVNHRWNTIDPVSGEPMSHLAHCFRGCLSEHYGEFYETVFAEISQAHRELLRSQVRDLGYTTIDESAGPACASLPGEIVSLTNLPRNHHAAQYLADRGYSIKELVARWGIGYCTEAFGPFAKAMGRIFIPVYKGGERVGWQGRWPADDWKARGVPKYYFLTGFKKSRLLYNYDDAIKQQYVIVVEGVTDVWSVGDGAVALFGKTVSPWQRAILAEWAERKALLILMLDPGAWTTEQRDREAAAVKHQATITDLTELFHGRFIEVTLPDGRDPGSLSRRELRKLVRQHVKEAGFSPKRYDL